MKERRVTLQTSAGRGNQNDADRPEPGYEELNGIKKEDCIERGKKEFGGMCRVRHKSGGIPLLNRN